MVGEPVAYVQALRLKAAGAVLFRFINSPISRDQDCQLAVGAPQALASGMEKCFFNQEIL